jgi:hypothetical protein
MGLLRANRIQGNTDVSPASSAGAVDQEGWRHLFTKYTCCVEQYTAKYTQNLSYVVQFFDRLDTSARCQNCKGSVTQHNKGKGKRRLNLRIIKRYTMKTYGGVEVKRHALSDQLNDPRETNPVHTGWATESVWT